MLARKVEEKEKACVFLLIKGLGGGAGEGAKADGRRTFKWVTHVLLFCENSITGKRLWQKNITLYNLTY
jgi:hypothetical protein